MISNLEYTRSVTSSMNQLLQGLEYDIAGEQTEDDSQEEWEQVLNTFSSVRY